MPDPARHTLVRSARDRVIDLLGIGETYPLTDVTVDAERLTVNFGSLSAFDICPGQKDVRYELYAQGKPVSPPCAVLGTGAMTVLPGPPIREDQTFQIRATKFDRSVFLTETATVKVGFDTSLRVYFPGPALVDFGAVALVRIERSQENALYQLAYVGADGAPVLTSGAMGTEGELSLSTGPVEEDTPIRVKVSRTFDPSEQRADISDFLTTTLSLSVRADPSRAVSAKGSPIVDPKAAAILVASSQKSVIYRAFVRPLRDAEFEFDRASGGPVLAIPVPAEAPDVTAHEVLVHTPAPPVDLQGYRQQGEIKAGSGGPLELALGPLGEDSLVVILADKGHSAIQLQQVVVALPRPDPAPGLTLTLSPGGGGPGSTLLVTGGQRGVFYHFRRAGQMTELGLPAYVHRLDHGIEQLRVEVDFVVTRDPPQDGDLARQLPLDPLVDLAGLAALAPGDTLTLDVMAVWARTGVGWEKPRQIVVIRSS